MRRGLLMTFAALAALTITARGQAQSTSTSVSYAIANRGAMSFETLGSASTAVVGYARVQPASSTAPASNAIIGYRQSGVLVSEAGVPGVNTMLSGRTYAEVNGVINTGIAFVNPNSSPVVLSYSFTDQFGNDFSPLTFTLNANEQIARFLNESPFNLRAGFVGTVTFSASAPVGVIALRSLINQRNEFLLTTQSVVPVPDSISAGTILLAQFADGAGWRTKVLLVNATDAAISGTVQFFGEGSASLPATPVTLVVNGQVGASFTYTIRARSSASLETSSPIALAAQVGSVQITPSGGSTPPSAFAVFSFTSNGVTVSQATVQAQVPGTAFRSYVEVTSSSAVVGAIQSSVAIVNNSSTNGVVNFELITLDGVSTGLTASVTVAGNGHVSKFVHELFPTVTSSFKGVLRISSFNSIGVMSLRGRYNERGNFLFTTTPVSNEAGVSSTAELLFPHIVDGGGYSTQFVLFSAITGQAPSGIVRFVGRNGQALNLTVR